MTNEKLSKTDIEFLESKAKRAKQTYIASFSGLFLMVPTAIFVFFVEGFSWTGFGMVLIVISLFFYGYSNRIIFKSTIQDIQNNFKEIGQGKITHTYSGFGNGYIVDSKNYLMDESLLFEVGETVKTNLAPISKTGLGLEKIKLL